ncbi:MULTISPECIES: endopeptidase La [Bacillus]|uniref:Lon protease n=1 Tax=Bacillus toyonensis TaxID=155322 RepID=A0A2A8HH84_9BACI|nr:MULTISPECIES: endopeptidase La [Bacillus]AFU15184.1 ATP-dependent protease La 1 [Bacillus thuringiensis MC28]EJR68144.1 lon protease [Bacillus cereus VD115]EOP21428.1 lon protease [Bacillus cereus VD131]KNH41122.1 peptidase [Bacillus thuringiensis]OTW88430.1 endopeptidase La [Bacillus thuringiensis serovar cameroun]OTX08483.1 endopeptidase La [Bacillus thuringiensis serovar seoulensis]OTX31432.1 endopeptidase La [Bacillus thuringiensis serovar malayensis]OUB11482.1 endopeptidase La [Baci
MSSMNTNERIVPLLPLRGVLVYPTMVLHLDVGRDKSIQALEQAAMDENIIFLAMQKEMNIDDPKEDDIYSVGTVAKVKQMLKLPNGTLRVLVEGLHRAEVVEFIEEENVVQVSIKTVTEEVEDDLEEKALMRTLLEHFEQYIKVSKKVSNETFATVADVEEPGRLADLIASHLPIKTKQKQEILEIVSVKERLHTLISIIQDEQELLSLEKKIGQKVKRSMERTQKEYFLREQMKAIQTELGDKEGKGGEVEELREKIEQSGMPEETTKAALKELDRYEKLPASSAESGVIRNYIDWLLALPWTEATEDMIDLVHSEEILNKDHYGLEKVKERVLEYLAVQKLTNSLKGPILCLVGPPGVGKTSLARSIATSLNRNFVRVSLGGVRDESEIRGHRRTYVGAMPGRIIQGMKKAKTVNPVFLLDEIDKMSNDFRGDPSAALLEVLDPEQNHNFSDHYIEEPYDLSKVMFVATANTLSSIPGPLLDRMEIISIAGYTELEKVHIAREHLLPKQLKEHGLRKGNLQVRDEALLEIIRYYTREAGVRTLERQIAKVCRKAAKIIVTAERKRIVVTEKNIVDLLGKHIFRYGQAEKTDQVGMATGLAYTAAGGDTLAIEVSVAPGKGKLILTGKLGDVMKESAQAAFSYIRSRAEELHIDPNFHEKNDIHIHVPEGAVPKDGPSAGITMATALISALTGIPVSKEVGMTGEITLRGRVLPIGGLKEKTLSAHRAGLTKIILPAENEKDLDDIPESVKENLTFVLASHLDEVLEHALVGVKQ